MEQSEIFEKIVNIFNTKNNIEKEKITMDFNFVNDGNLDSLDTVELIMEMEEEFAIKIDDDEAVEIKTVGDAVRFVQDRQKENKNDSK